MRRLTGTETAILGVIHAIRRSTTLMPPIGWPVEIESGTFTPEQAICKVKVTLPDLNLPGRSMGTIHFSLERRRVRGAEKYVYSVRDNRINIHHDFPEVGDHFVTTCHYVSNTYAQDDDFVVPVGTPRETEIQLMQVSTRDLRRWIVSNPLRLTVWYD